MIESIKNFTRVFTSLFSRIEPLVFLLLVTLNLIPAVTPEYFPTLDGPAHLYNAAIIGDLLSDQKSFYAQFVEFNPIFVPNAVSHYVLWFLNLIFSPSVSSKLMVGGYLFLLPYAFRYCILKFNPEGKPASYLVFPFTYAFTLCMGFYSYHIGFIFLLFTIGLLSNFFTHKSPVKRAVLLLITITLAYFSHILIFAATGTVICLFVLLNFFKREDNRTYFKHLLLLLTASLPGLIMSYAYFQEVTYDGAGRYLPKYELLNFFNGFKSIICYRQEAELIYSSLIFIVFMVLAGSVLQKLLSDRSSTRKNLSACIKNIPVNQLLIGCSAVFLILYFYMPDFTVNGGIISTRLCFITMLFLALWLASNKIPQLILIPAVILVLYCQVKLVTDHDKAFEAESAEIAQYHEIEKHIPERSTLIGFNRDSWNGDHNSNYLGLNKKIVIIDNYELFNPYFPLKWKKSNPLSGLINSGSQILHMAQNPDQRPDFVLIRKSPNDTTPTLDPNLQPFYHPEFHTAKLWLFKRN